MRRGIQRVAVDMDGVLAEDRRLRDDWNAAFPELALSAKQQRNFKLEKDVRREYTSAQIEQVFVRRGIDISSYQNTREQLVSSDEYAAYLERETLRAQVGRRQRLLARFGFAKIPAPEPKVVSWDKLIDRAIRDQVLGFINTSGFHSSLEPIQENIEQLKRLIDSGVDVYILTALPNENIAGEREKTAWLKRHLGMEYFNKLRMRIYVAGQKMDKGDLIFDAIFEDNPRLSSHLGVLAGLHLIVETDHNRHIVPSLLQKVVQRGDGWPEAIGVSNKKTA